MDWLLSPVIDGVHRCSACKEWKIEGAFSRNRATECGLGNQCKKCFCAGNKVRYAAGTGNSYNRAAMQLKRERGRSWLAEEAIRRGGCADYGKAALGWDGRCIEQWTVENYLFVEWDHLPGFIKKFELARCTRSIEVLSEEAAKCDTVCRLHHSYRTQQRRILVTEVLRVGA